VATAIKSILRAIDTPSLKAPHEFNPLLTKPSCFIELKIRLSNATIEQLLSALTHSISAPTRKTTSPPDRPRKRTAAQSELFFEYYTTEATRSNQVLLRKDP
jgi:hypothetical protein